MSVKSITESGYIFFSNAAGFVVDAVVATAETVRKVVNIGITDIPPETLNGMRIDLSRTEDPRFSRNENIRSRPLSKRIASNVNSSPSQINLVPQLIEQGWLDESSKHFSANSLSNQIALLSFSNPDGSGWTVPRCLIERR